jgi:hypothetical protein
LRKLLTGEFATMALLIVGLVGLFILSPLADMGLIHNRFVEISYWVFMALGVAAISHHPIIRWAGLVCALGATVADLMEGRHAGLLECCFTVIYVVLFGSILWRRVFTRGPVTTDKLVAAVTLYMLLGVFFTQLFQLIELLHPGSFTFGPDFGGMPLESRLRYFSYITLTTVGYGDATPSVPIAHAMAVLEALTGQFYLAILIGRLVSNLQMPVEEE